MEDEEKGGVDGAVSELEERYGVDEGSASMAILLFDTDLNDVLMGQFKKLGFVKSIPIAISVLRVKCRKNAELSRRALTAALVADAVAVAALVAALLA